MIHAHCTYGDRPLDGLLSLQSTERTFGRRCPFDFSGFFFSLYFSFLVHSRYTDRTSPRLLLHCIEYYTHGRNDSITSLMFLITNK